jgi:hypothetical protein
VLSRQPSVSASSSYVSVERLVLGSPAPPAGCWIELGDKPRNLYRTHIPQARRNVAGREPETSVTVEGMTMTIEEIRLGMLCEEDDVVIHALARRGWSSCFDDVYVGHDRSVRGVGRPEIGETPRGEKAYLLVGALSDSGRGRARIQRWADIRECDRSV